MMKTLFTERAALRKLGIVLAGGVTLMVAQGVAGAAVTGILGSKHDLSSSSTYNKFTATNGTSEICAFCHTPHGADTAAPVPLWNRKMSASSSYTTYAALGTTTLDGATAPVGSVSLACLSCHDGTQAMNTVINQAGSGGYNSAGATQAGTWSGSGLAQSASPVGSLSNAGIALIGTDLKNDHPVGIQYAGGGFTADANKNVSDADATGTPKDPDFKIPKARGNGTSAVFWVDTGTTGRQKTDLILYTRDEAVDYKGTAISGGAQPYVECASCHDPHAGAAKTFLRIDNASSAVCLACHTK